MSHHKSPSVAFFGTPEFALPSLEMLVKRGFSVSLVITAPDRPKGRGLQLTPPPVKTLAGSLGLKVFQPETLKKPEVITEILSHKPDILVVVAYGRLIPSELFRSVPYGAINVHPSLLPRYRGPAPIQRTILAGEEITGVTIMIIDEGIDSGPILASKFVPLAPFETAGELSEKLAKEGANLLVEILPKWISGEITPVPQNDAEATFAPAIRKEETRIDWSMESRYVINTCRAFDPVPGAFTTFRGKRIKCYGAARPSMDFPEGVPGKVMGVSREEGLIVCAGDGKMVGIKFLQMEGKKRLPAVEFVKGMQGIIGSRLGE